MTINWLKLVLSLALAPAFAIMPPAYGQPLPTIRMADATAPAELIACARGTVSDDAQSTFENAIAGADERLIAEARRLRIARVTESFVNQIDQTQDGNLPTFELCRGIDARPAAETTLSLREMSPHPLRIGYCPSTDAERCRDALKAVIAAPSSPTASQTPSPAFVVTRAANWNGASPPSSTAQMLDAVYRLTPVSIAPQTGASDQTGEPVEVRDEKPRAAGSLLGAQPDGAPVRLDPPAHRPAIGFIFAVSK
jgi:hypothetical protein